MNRIWGITIGATHATIAESLQVFFGLHQDAAAGPFLAAIVVCVFLHDWLHV